MESHGSEAILLLSGWRDERQLVELVFFVSGIGLRIRGTIVAADGSDLSFNFKSEDQHSRLMVSLKDCGIGFTADFTFPPEYAEWMPRDWESFFLGISFPNGASMLLFQLKE